jgi:hypothetical protein
MIDSRFTSLEAYQPLQPHTLQPFNYSGVYFLCQGEEVVYVGQSKNVGGRITSHIDTKSFDSVLIIPVPEENLRSVETYWIERLKPVLNRSLEERCPPRRVRRSNSRSYTENLRTKLTDLSTQPALPRSLTKRQLAAELDVSIRTVDTWMQLRKIPYRKVGRMVRFDLDRVMAALDRYVIREIS